MFEGEARFGNGKSDTLISHLRLVVFGNGDAATVRTGPEPVRFLLVSGKPLGKPIARYGSFVMDTEREIEDTLLELRQGTFVTT